MTEEFKFMAESVGVLALICAFVLLFGRHGTRRDAFIVSLLGIFGCASTAFANSCGNVDVIGTYDKSGLQESDFGIYAVGTFRIAGEGDEHKQPMFNLTKINCEKQLDLLAVRTGWRSHRPLGVEATSVNLQLHCPAWSR